MYRRNLDCRQIVSTDLCRHAVPVHVSNRIIKFIKEYYTLPDLIPYYAIFT